LTFAAATSINPSTRTLSISIGKVPLVALKPTLQELICAHGIGNLVMDPTEEQQRSELQELEYTLRDAEGRFTTTFVVDDNLATFANQLRDWIRNLLATTHYGIFETSPNL
jgi:hypothetical protein